MTAAALFLLVFSTIFVLATLAARLNLTFPIVFLLGGIALAAMMPDIGNLAIPPHYILFLFLPPLLMESAYFTSLRDFRASIVPILQLAVVLVLVTVITTGLVAEHLIPGMSFAVGAVLGAIISPPDAVAATAMLRSSRIPKRIVTILEGESLVNDASALVLYALAVGAVMTGHFSLQEASYDFLWMAAGGVATGLVIAYAYLKFFPFIREPSIEILSTFLLPYLAYAMAESIEASGVLAVVAGGLYVAWNSPQLFSSEFRLPAKAIWKMAVFVLNALVFLLIGLKVPGIVMASSSMKLLSLVGYAVIICASTLLVRIVWVFISAYGTPLLIPALRNKDADPPWQNVFMVAWTGMRGVVSLATALALPYTLSDGTPFPFRDELLFITLCVILITLVGQGLTLPFVLRKLPLRFNPRLAYEDWYARVYTARQAISRLHEVAAQEGIPSSAFTRILSFYEDRIAILGDGPNTPLAAQEIPGTQEHPLVRAEHNLWKVVLKTEEEAILSLRRSYHIGDDVMHELLQDVDLLAHRFK